MKRLWPKRSYFEIPAVVLAGLFNLKKQNTKQQQQPKKAIKMLLNSVHCFSSLAWMCLWGGRELSSCQIKESVNLSDNRRNQNLRILKETQWSWLSWRWTLTKPLFYSGSSLFFHHPQPRGVWASLILISGLSTLNRQLSTEMVMDITISSTEAAVFIMFTWSCFFNLSGIVPWSTLSLPNWARGTKGVRSPVNGERDT